MMFGTHHLPFLSSKQQREIFDAAVLSSGFALKSWVLSMMLWSWWKWLCRNFSGNHH